MYSAHCDWSFIIFLGSLLDWNWSESLRTWSDLIRTLATVGGIGYAAYTFREGNRLARERDEENHKRTSQRETVAHERTVKRDLLNLRRLQALEMVRKLNEASGLFMETMAISQNPSTNEFLTMQYGNLIKCTGALKEAEMIQVMHFKGIHSEFRECVGAGETLLQAMGNKLNSQPTVLVKSEPWTDLYKRFEEKSGIIKIKCSAILEQEGADQLPPPTNRDRAT